MKMSTFVVIYKAGELVAQYFRRLSENWSWFWMLAPCDIRLFAMFRKNRVDPKYLGRVFFRNFGYRSYN